MRCFQLLERLGRNAILLDGSNRCWKASRAAQAYATTSSEEAASNHAREGPIFAAFVLQRLPLVRTPVPHNHAEHLIWSRQRGLETGELKDYPESALKARMGTGSQQKKQDMRTFVPVPSVTAADVSGDVRSMRRKLSEGLYLVVRSRPDRGGQQQLQGRGAAGGAGSLAAAPGAAAGAAADAAGREGGGGVWGFPTAAHTGEESIGDTAHRALTSVIGRSHPIFRVGRAPMAHIRGPVASGKTFFMLGTAMDDPWDIRLVADGPAEDFAWVTKEELLRSFITDARMRELVSKML